MAGHACQRKACHFQPYSGISSAWRTYNVQSMGRHEISIRTGSLHRQNTRLYHSHYYKIGVAGKTEITEITTEITEITMGITEITIVGSSRGRYDMVG